VSDQITEALVDDYMFYGVYDYILLEFLNVQDNSWLNMYVKLFTVLALRSIL